MTKPLIKIGVIVGFVAALVIYILWSMRVPPPREADRVVHRDGIYSIIAPRGWEVSFDYASKDQKYIDTLQIRFPTEKRDRRIFLARLRGEPDLDTIRARDKQIASEFQGQPAHVFTGNTRLEPYWRALFQRGADWYELVFWMRYPEDFVDWEAYLQSFRARDGAPATAPTTAAAA